MLMAVEEHGAGRQLVRVRAWPRCSRWRLALTISLAALAAGAALDGAWAVCAVLGGEAALLFLCVFVDCGVAMAATLRALSTPAAGVA